MKRKQKNTDQEQERSSKNKQQVRPAKTAKTTSQKIAAFKRRDLLILLSVWGVGCAIVALLIGVFRSQSVVEVTPTPQPIAAYELSFEGETAKNAYLRALAGAQQWQRDVELVATSTFWPEATLEAITQFGTWDFRFFSPARQRVYFAIASDEQPVVGRPHIYKRNNTSTPLVDPAEWLVDSDEALTIWVNDGGGPFLENFPGSSVELLLRQLPQQGGLVWDIIAVSQDQSQLFYLSIDASNGSVIR